MDVVVHALAVFAGMFVCRYFVYFDLMSPCGPCGARLLVWFGLRAVRAVPFLGGKGALRRAHHHLVVVECWHALRCDPTSQTVNFSIFVSSRRLRWRLVASAL